MDPEKKAYFKFAFPKQIHGDMSGPHENGVPIDLEVVVSAWLDEYTLGLKMYDIVTMKRRVGDTNCKQVLNETFNIMPSTKTIKTLHDHRHRLKRVSCLDETQKVLNILVARSVKRDHKDSILRKSIPKGYKICGLKGFKMTHSEEVLHIIDFIIWKPPENWLVVDHLLPRPKQLSTR